MEQPKGIWLYARKTLDFTKKWWWAIGPALGFALGWMVG